MIMYCTKKRIIGILLLFSLLLAGVMPSATAITAETTATLDYNAIKVTLNGHEVELVNANGDAVEPFAISGTTYLPIRAISDALGLAVAWDQTERTVQLASAASAWMPGVNLLGLYVDPATLPATTARIKKGLEYSDIKVTLDGKPVDLVDVNGTPVEPFAIEGTTYLPIRAISTALGLDVEWDQASKTVVLTTRVPEDYLFGGNTLCAGDTVTFGAYEQDGNLSNGKEPIEWTVLSAGHDRAFLISKYCLDAKAYHQTGIDVTWKTSDLRKWLNDAFLKDAFSKEEQLHIMTTELKNTWNWKYFTGAGGPTQDQIFLLSIDEVTHYFPANADRMASGTEYAEQHNPHIYEKDEEGSIWWLRSPGFWNSIASYISKDGKLHDNGLGVYEILGVRPAMWVSLKPTAQLTQEEQAAKRNIQVNDIITFGAYEQDNVSSGKEDIEWVVLAVEDGKALLLSKYCLEELPYNSEADRVTWETCSLRKWMNEEFFYDAFTPEEQERILSVTNTNYGYYNRPLLGSNDTVDRVFLLSLHERNQYVSSRISSTKNTAYADRRHDWPSPGVTCWWFRTPGVDYAHNAAFANIKGETRERSVETLNGVRPALWLKLE